MRKIISVSFFLIVFAVGVLKAQDMNEIGNNLIKKPRFWVACE